MKSIWPLGMKNVKISFIAFYNRNDGFVSGYMIQGGPIFNILKEMYFDVLFEEYGTIILDSEGIRDNTYSSLCLGLENNNDVAGNDQ